MPYPIFTQTSINFIVSFFIFFIYGNLKHLISLTFNSKYKHEYRYPDVNLNLFGNLNFRNLVAIN